MSIKYNTRSVCSKIIRKVKRHIAVYLFPVRTKKQLEYRQGSCSQCGKCCKLVFKCPMLNENDSFIKCLIYHKRSKVCSLFPISEEDLKDVNYLCGYRFKKMSFEKLEK